MKFLVHQENNETKVAINDNERVINLDQLINDAQINDINYVIANIDAIEQKVERANVEVKTKNAADVHYLPAVDPSTIICVGLNYRKHAEETNAPIPESPILFNKFKNTINAHNGVVPLPKKSQEVDYEVELGIVIGKHCKDVSVDEALHYVAGYTAVNDFSARDLQMKTPQWMLGKISDGFCPAGPNLVTKSTITDPNNLTLKTTLNGKVRQDSNTSDMIFSCAEIVSYLSEHMTLSPGDLILTGTPEGVILGDPEGERVWLKDGDELVVEIEKIGQLKNTMVDEK
ncbi:fumarylacetoacetate hydrolase family protein [Pseudogracilibacillus auburnensis]|uniref:2-keto-4-pentenoate hydratase/2-oxohepta-3-ene-1,7-dioic acid hydratase in catechol pathway n=1 Tax=Pseudogracilibacillus auburnensis TaxID=1494959 RepID=A0A2V3W206_9BACI|nr:fumarylacetoacetate hydrolase family protein [Pseudogracilibacillus auburnensis]MBO1002328.1 fumarylacetoacetate hydrolase family protein [Pseudogracilibacillus auburnensis]PXW86285.1 2-keto-4-pentenoate hydratase/2-oxohepta-3-ene-1,7-dioic acid hydratase in catechol pathway [Pseudogracilibacillus auburnensis]